MLKKVLMSTTCCETQKIKMNWWMDKWIFEKANIVKC